MISRTVRLALGLALLGAIACAIGVATGVQRARRAAEEGRLEEAVAELERLRADHPGSSDVRLELGVAYYRLARRALDRDREQEYLTHLEKALDAVVEAVRLAPESPGPHTWMGIIAAYRDDLGGALRSFQNARRLDPRQPVSYANIAQIYLYQGKVSRAWHWIEKAKRHGGRGAYLDLLEALVAWRQGDLVEARDLFSQAYELDPDTVNTWDEAPVDRPIETFEDFASYCCSNHTCGPHMGSACERLRLAVRERKLREETVRRELLLEMERRRKLRQIYEGRKELKIEIEPPEEPD
ncbi:MAG: tetratricopeptide repeat protein [Myxococcota bacterium]